MYPTNVKSVEFIASANIPTLSNDELNYLSANPTKSSNTPKQLVGCCQRIA